MTSTAQSAISFLSEAVDQSKHPFVTQDDAVGEVLIWINTIIDALIIAVDAYVLSSYILPLELYFFAGFFLGKELVDLGKLIFDIVISFI